jgi:hypothetical protein
MFCGSAGAAAGSGDEIRSRVDAAFEPAEAQIAKQLLARRSRTGKSDGICDGIASAIFLKCAETEKTLS